MDNFFKGKYVVVTGTMHKSRGEVLAELSSVGAIVQNAVNGNTDYLICGSRVGESKTSKATARGIPLLNREDYHNAMQGAMISNAAHATVIVPKLTHAEYIASCPETYGAW